MDTNAPTLPSDVFEAVVTAFAETLVRHYRERFARRGPQLAAAPAPPPPVTRAAMEAPWLRVTDAAKRARCARSTIYAEVATGRLRASRVGGGRILRIRQEWVDEWLQGGTGQK